MKRILSVLFLFLIILIAILLFNTLRFKSTQLEIPPIEAIAIDRGAVDRMVDAIAIRTVSFENEADFDSSQFRLFNTFLEENYPKVFEELEHKVFSGFSHLFTWKGVEEEQRPIVLMGHIDVVPIASPAMWTEHPFTAGVHQDTIWGRGAMDDKVGVIGILEATEQLLKEGFKPKRNIYLAFGHDEEVSGHQGAEKIANYLVEQGIEAAFVLDEGGAMVKGLIPDFPEKVGMIGVAEKGYLTLNLEIAMAGGHSSMPAKETSIDVLSAAIARLKQNPLPRKMSFALKGFMDKIGPEMDFMTKLAFANSYLFQSVILDTYEASNSGNASIRTTTSPTIFEAGIKENVIPTAAQAVVNFRIIPGETIESVIAHVKEVVDDERVQVSIKGLPFNPSPVSPSDNSAYRTIEQTIREVYPSTLVTSSLVVGATDARYYSKVSPNVYRFSPIVLTPETVGCFHGIDERLAVSEFEDGIRFYRQLILNGGM